MDLSHRIRALQPAINDYVIMAKRSGAGSRWIIAVEATEKWAKVVKFAKIGME